MNGFRQTNHAKLIRRVTETLNGLIAVDDNPIEDFFGVQLIQTARSRKSSDSASPRSQDTLRMRYLSAPYSPSNPLGAGCRLSINGRQFELLTAPRDYRVAFTGDMYEVPILPVDVLYPYQGDLHVAGADGDLVEADVRFSFFSADESAGDTGIYQDFRAEAPIEYRSQLKVNHELRAEDTLKIVNRDVDRAGMFVDLAVRKTGANQS